MTKKKNEKNSNKVRELETLDEKSLAQVTGGIGAIKPGDPLAIALPTEERR